MRMNLIDISPKALRRAAHLQERILGLQQQLRDLLGNQANSAPSTPADSASITTPTGRKRRRMSAAAKAKIAAAARKRWASAKAAGRSHL